MSYDNMKARNPENSLIPKSGFDLLKVTIFINNWILVKP